MEVIVWVLQDTAAAKHTAGAWSWASDSNYVKSVKIYFSQRKQKPRQSEKTT
jgi:hypothetical protein